MIIWRSTDEEPSSPALAEQVYNGLDCCVTVEVLEALLPKLTEVTGATYDWACRLQAPILEMELRGCLIDKQAINSVSALYRDQAERVQLQLDRILSEGLGIDPINPGSWQQKNDLLYNRLGLPPVRKRGKITSDRSALEKLSLYFHAEIICQHIILLQDLRKKLGFLKTPIGEDGRMRTSFNIAGTDTGRLSSYASAFYDGTNLQNIAPEMRRIFIADPGMKLAYIDLEQAESRAVGAIIWNLFGDPGYLDFCESGDLHTNVARMTFKHLPWTDDMRRNKEIASGRFYRDLSYRDACKRLGHGSNYHGQPPQMAKETRIPVGLVTEFQREYFTAFPGIPRWHESVRRRLLREGWITTFMGRHRWFFGRRWDNQTLNAAIAYEPQSAIGDYLNRGMHSVWKAGCCELLVQIHDAILIQYPEELEDEIVPKVCALLEHEVPLMNGRTLRIPTEAATGWNWAYKSEKNPDGIAKYKGTDKRKRTPPVGFLDQLFS